MEDVEREREMNKERRKKGMREDAETMKVGKGRPGLRCRKFSGGCGAGRWGEMLGG